MEEGGGDWNFLGGQEGGTYPECYSTQFRGALRLAKGRRAGNYIRHNFLLFTGGILKTGFQFGLNQRSLGGEGGASSEKAVLKTCAKDWAGGRKKSFIPGEHEAANQELCGETMPLGSGQSSEIIVGSAKMMGHGPLRV